MTDRAEQSRLTEMEFWDKYWDRYELPVEIKPSDSLYTAAILEIFDRFLPPGRGRSILEIGGSPGQFLAYMHRRHGYDVHCLDYSPIGCEKTRQNFALLGIPAQVHERDLFAGSADLPLFDVVYSLGFVEHFTDLTGTVEKHLALLKPGGILVIGVPNLLGVNHWFLKRLAPGLLAQHHLHTMDLANWTHFEEEFRLSRLFKEYVGGFEPGVFNKLERRTISNRIFKMGAKALHHLLKRRLKFVRRFNSKRFSGYALGVFVKPEGGSPA